jgi:hypothetical protein
MKLPQPARRPRRARPVRAVRGLVVVGAAEADLVAAEAGPEAGVVGLAADAAVLVAAGAPEVLVAVVAAAVVVTGARGVAMGVATEAARVASFSRT